MFEVGTSYQLEVIEHGPDGLEQVARYGIVAEVQWPLIRVIDGDDVELINVASSHFVKAIPRGRRTSN